MLVVIVPVKERARVTVMVQAKRSAKDKVKAGDLTLTTTVHVEATEAVEAGDVVIKITNRLHV